MDAMIEAEVDAPVLSNEEVDALLKAGQDKNVDLSALGINSDHPDGITQDSTALANITDAIRLEWEKAMSAFLRKKISIKVKSTATAQAGVVLEPSDQKYVYTLFRIPPNDHFGLIVTSMPFLHHTINLLYGGKINHDESIMESPGKVGVIVAEKFSHIFLTGFSEACKDYGTVNYEIVKSTPFANLLSSLSLDENVYSIESSIIIDESESTFKFIVMTEFLTNFFPQKKHPKHKEKDFWRSAINTQVSDSIVNISVTLPDVSMKMHEVMALKEGDTIAISDPTMVYISLNNLKLFRASAGQTNNQRVVKIISQI
jgi:flagellar motor switch protein FliM